MIVGIAGGSGSGKTHLAERLVAHLGDRARLLRHDDYYRVLTPEESAAARADAFNFDHPSALDSDLLAAHLDALRAGHPVDVPTYDFSSHARAGAVRLAPADVIVVEGVLTLATENIVQRLDLAVFVDAAEWVRLARRVERDTATRGRSLASVLRQYFGTVRPMHEAHVAPSAARAALQVRGDDDVGEALTQVLEAMAALGGPAAG